MSNPASTEWSRFADAHSRLASPLRPTEADVAAVRGAIASHGEQVLLYGVTPELAGIGTALTAFDASPRMLAEVWPGDTVSRRAVRGDWLDLPIRSQGVTAVVGDGVVNAIGGNLGALFAEARRVLSADGVAAFRVFCAPEQPETLSAILHDAGTGRIGNFHALKLRVAMALAVKSPERSIPVTSIRAGFDTLFPNRAWLRDRTGWRMRDIDTIDFYEGAGHSLLFPPISMVRAIGANAFKDIRVVASEGYPLAELCPLFVMRAAAT